MPPRERLTREQKGKTVSTGLDPLNVSVTSSENLARQHRDALGDTEGLDLSQRLLVVEAERLVRGEHDRDSRESELREEGNSADARTEGPDFYPTRYSPDGYFKKLPAVPAELLRSPDVEGQDWERVGETESTPGSVQNLLKECGARGVMFLIPTYLERPWSPPVCQFVNGSYRIVVALMVLAAEIGVSLNVRAFEELTSLKAQPHGIFSVKMRPNYNILTGHPNKTPGWNRSYFFVKSDKAAFDNPPRDNFRVLWNCRSVDHPKVLDYPEGFFDNAQAVAALSHQHWPDISEERIRRALARISKVFYYYYSWVFSLIPFLADYLLLILSSCADDWATNLPCKEDPGKKRLQLFTKKEQMRIKRSKKMKELPDLSVLLGDELEFVGSNPMSILDGMDLGGGGGFGESGLEARKERSRNDDSAQTVAEEVGIEERPRKKKKKKSAEKSQEGSVLRGEPTTRLEEDLNRAVVHDQDVSSGEQLLRRARKTLAEGPITRSEEELQIIQVPNEERVSPNGGDFTRHSSPQRPGDGIPTLSTGPQTTIQDRVEFSYVGDCFLIRIPFNAPS
ncbi:hypothetical protein N665_1173s0004 [Sinapis alba]|nr:hypothetical protein N665_1173s0004 [Sinapis alba]